MNRSEYMPLLLSKGFKFEKTTLSYPGWRGDEDIYTKKPKFKYTFRVFRIYKGKPNYGLYVGVGNQFRELDNLVADNIDIEGTDKTLPIWTGEAFIELMKNV